MPSVVALGTTVKSLSWGAAARERIDDCPLVCYHPSVRSPKRHWGGGHPRVKRAHCIHIPKSPDHCHTSTAAKVGHSLGSADIARSSRVLMVFWWEEEDRIHRLSRKAYTGAMGRQRFAFYCPAWLAHYIPRIGLPFPSEGKKQGSLVAETTDLLSSFSHGTDNRALWQPR